MAEREALPALEAIGEQVVRAAATAEARRARGLRRRRLALVVAILVVLVASVAVAATQIIGTGRPVPEPPRGSSTLGKIVPGTTRLLRVRAADPDGGPPWGLRVFRTEDGAACVQAGRVVRGRLGVLGQDGVFGDDRLFHELPVRADACGGLAPHGELLMQGGSNTQTASGFDGAGIPGVGGCETAYDRRIRKTGDLRSLRAALRLQLQRGERAAARIERRVIARFERRARLHIPLCPRADLRDVVWGFAGSGARAVTFTEGAHTITVHPSPADSGAYVLVLRGNYAQHRHLVRHVAYAPGQAPRPPARARRTPPPPPPPMHIPITPLRGLAIRFTPPFAGHRYEVMLRCRAKLVYNALTPTVLPAGRPRTVRLRGPIPPFCAGKGRLPGEVLDATTGRRLGTFRLRGG